MDVVGLLLDVGPSMGFEDRAGSSCLEKCKNIISMFIQRKIFSQSDDKVCLFTYGSAGTANELAADDEYVHISMESDLRQADWDLCNFVQNQIEATNHQVDFLDALIVMSTYLINQVNAITDKKVQKKLSDGRRVIMIFSNLDNPVRSDNAELKKIIHQFKENNLELHFISPTGFPDPDNGEQPGTSDGASNRPPDDRHSKPKSQNQLKSESIAQQIITELDGCAYDFREAMAAVSVFESKKKNPMAWSPDLVIGSSLKIPISGYKMVTREPMPSFKKCSVRSPEEAIEKKYDTFLPDDEGTSVDKEDIIKGYRYGTDLVPFSEDDMANMKYKCEVREFSVIGFTQSSNVKRHYFAGKDTMLIAAKKNDAVAATALSALCKALQETETVAVVRKVYSARSTPSIGALIPVIEDEKEYLYFIELPFMEDMRELEFPSLAVDPQTSSAQSKNAPTSEQMDAVDGLIDAMDMSAQPEDGDPLGSGEPPNPTLQRLYQVLAAKATDPRKSSLPDISPMISNLVNNEVYSSRWIGRDQDRFSELFKLERVSKSGKGDAENVYKESNVAENARASGDQAGGDSRDLARLRDLDQDAITEVRTIDPVGDFQAMLKQPTMIIKAYTDMPKRIMQLVTDSVGNTLYGKALQCLKALRLAAVTGNDKDNLMSVNDFLLSMKSLLTTKGPEEFWKLIVQDNLSLISTADASNSLVTPSDKEAYMLVTMETEDEQKPAPIDDDEYLLDMMD